MDNEDEGDEPSQPNELAYIGRRPSPDLCFRPPPPLPWRPIRFQPPLAPPLPSPRAPLPPFTAITTTLCPFFPPPPPLPWPPIPFPPPLPSPHAPLPPFPTTTTRLLFPLPPPLALPFLPPCRPFPLLICPPLLLPLLPPPRPSLFLPPLPSPLPHPQPLLLPLPAHHLPPNPPPPPPHVNLLVFPFMYATVYALFFMFAMDFDDILDDRNISRYVKALSLAAETVSSVGYGDIVPNNGRGKVLTSLVIVFVHAFLSCWAELFLMYLCYNLVNILERYKFDKLVGWLKWAGPLAVPLICLAVGSVGIYYFEGLNFWDCVYWSLVSASTVGYGDVEIRTTGGVIFADIWIGISSVICGKGFAYLSGETGRRVFGY